MGSKGPDTEITQQVNMKLANRGIRTPCKVTVTTSSGDVTLTGTVQYPHQKAGALSAASGVRGVRRVVDQMKVVPVKRQ